MWKLFKDDFERLIDIIPEDEHHKFGKKCWCNPEYKTENGWLIFTHNSFDQREYLVEGKLMEIVH